MAPGGLSIDPVRTQNELLSCSRELTMEDLGIVISHRIIGRSGTPVKFQVYDPFPSQFAVDDIGFHPDYRPSHGRIDAEAAVISGVVGHDEEIVVRYGLCPAQPRPPDAIEEIHQSTRPSLEISGLVGPDDAVEDELEQATVARSTRDEEAPDSGSTSPLSRWKRRLLGRGQPARADGDRDSDAKRVDEAEGPDVSTIDEATSAGSGAGRSADENTEDLSDSEAAQDDAVGTGSKVDSDRDSDSVVERIWGQGGDPFGQSEANGELAAGIAKRASDTSTSLQDELGAEDDRRASREYQTFEAILEQRQDERRGPAARTSQRSAADTGSTGQGKPFVTRLIEQLDAGESTPEQRERLAVQLAEMVISEDPSLASLDERLGKLEATVNEYQPLTAQMEAVIDEHGTGEAVLESFNEQIGSISSRIDRLDERIAQGVNDRATLRNRLERVTEDLERIESRLTEVEDRLDSLRETHRSRSRRVRRRSTELRSTLETVRDLNRAARRLQAKTEAQHTTFEQIRRVFADDGQAAD